jgi:flavin-dependent dehydrogenase
MPTGFRKDFRTVAIIGGGPAGSATAIALLRALQSSHRPVTGERFNVRIYADPPKGTFRVGESLPPAASGVLRALGLEHVTGPQAPHLACAGTSSLWGNNEPGHNDFMLDTMGQGYHLDREFFDVQLLSEALKAGAELFQDWHLVGAQELYDGAALDFRTGKGERHTVHADFVVDASGHASAFARRIGVARNTLDEVLFLCAFADIPPGDSMTGRTMVEAVSDGWWYAARLPGNKAILTFCTDRQTARQRGYKEPDHWLGALGRTRWLRHQLPPTFTETAATLHMRAAPSTLLSAVTGSSWLAVGDAASSFDPVSSAGITKALIAATKAGPAIASWLAEGHRKNLHAYADHVLRDFADYARVRAELYSSERRFRDQGFWLRRLGLDGQVKVGVHNRRSTGTAASPPSIS